MLQGQTLAAGEDSASTNNRFYIRTYKGHMFYWDDLAGNTYDIEDIAHALSNNCRWGGHTKKFYSVAQHSVLCSWLVPQEMRLEALLHDAAEAYVHDTPTPLKRHLVTAGFSAFAELEQEIEKQIAKQFGVSFPLRPEVKEADAIMLATEHRDLMPPGREGKFMVEPAAFHVQPWDPRFTKRQFLETYRTLTREQGQ